MSTPGSRSGPMLNPDTGRRKSRVRGSALILLSATAFGIMPVLAKEAYAHGLVISQLLPLRFWFASLGLLLLAVIFEGTRFRHSIRHLPGAVILGVLYALQTAVFFIALQSTPASVAVLLFFTFPTMIAVTGWLFLHRPLTGSVVAALVTGFLGLTLTLGDAQLGSLSGGLLALGAAAANACYFLYAETQMSKAPVLLVCAVGLAFGASVFTVWALAQGNPILPTTDTGWLLVLSLALVPIVGLPSLLIGLIDLGATSSAVLSAWEPVLSVMAAVVLLAEPFTAVQLAGAVLVVTSVILAQRIPASA